MLDVSRYSCLGAALRDALERWPNEICLIEAIREFENCRLTYQQFKEAALPLAKAMQDFGFKPGSRAAIIMTNQSKWLISAYAIFHCGGVLVPLDHKLSAAELWQLLKHSGAEVLITEHSIWRQLSVSSARAAATTVQTVLVTEALANANLDGGLRWEECRGLGEAVFVARRRTDTATIVYSSGTGGRPKGCVLTHENYLEQCRALTAWYPMRPGVRYLSILPTNHAVDFMGGFIMPLVSGASVVHLRALSLKYVHDAFVRYQITHACLVPLILKSWERRLRAEFEELPPWKRFMLGRTIALNKMLTRGRPRVKLSRLLLPGVRRAFGGGLLTLLTGGAFADPSTLQFFYDLGLPVVNAYGMTEGCTSVTANDLNPFRAGTVGKPLPGVELRILSPDTEGIGEVAVRSKTVMSHYLDDPEMTAETIVNGWLLTGDIGRLDATGHLQLFGRKKNMIVTPGGKNIYPEDFEGNFEGLPVKEFCIFAANYIWPKRSMAGEQLVLVLHLEPTVSYTDTLHCDIKARNNRLRNYKRIHGVVLYNEDFPRTTSLRIMRNTLAERLATLDRTSAVHPL
jgi:long-chain acyl-CoA synthetase